MVFNGIWGVAMFGRRLIAYIIDCGVLGVVYYFLNKYILDSQTFAIQFGVCNIIALFYFSMLESSPRQATIGKSILKLKVCDMYGNRLPFIRALIRNLVRYVNMFIFAIGYLPILFTKKQQGIHDMVARSLVVGEAESENEEYD